MIKYQAVLPSSLLDIRQPIDMNFSQKINNDMSLKVGAVLEIIELDDDKNQSKLVPEYDVMVVEDNNTSIYKNCVTMDMFGGSNDFFQFKLKGPEDKKKVKDSGSLKKQGGSIVLMLCLNKSSESAIIIGALSHPDKKPLLTKELGHHLEGEFNGLNWKVDKDGALTITFKTPNDKEGKPTDEEAAGSNLKIEKDGSIEVGSGETESIRIDKTENTITMKAKKDVSVTVDENINLTAKKNIAIKSTADLLAEASGSAKMMSGGAFDLEAGGALKVKAASVEVDAGGGLKVKGAQISLDSSLIQLGKGGTPAIIFSTQFLGIGNLGSPVLSQAIGGFSSSVFIGS